MSCKVMQERGGYVQLLKKNEMLQILICYEESKGWIFVH